MHENIVERRSAPRFAVALEGQALTGDGHRSAVNITNISASGLEFTVAQVEMPWLLPNISEENAMTPVSIELTIELGKEKKVVKVQCGIVYVQRKSMNTCIIGCRFEKFFEDGQERLEHYISDTGCQLLPQE